MYIGLGSEGDLHIQSQVEDYILQGHGLEAWNVLDFFIGTYEEEVGKNLGVQS